MGDHSLIQKGEYKLNYIEFMNKLRRFETMTLPMYHQFHDRKSTLAHQFSEDLRFLSLSQES